MSLQVCILGIDGSGKSTVVAALPSILAAETGLVVGSAGDSFRIVTPDEDHLASEVLSGRPSTRGASFAQIQALGQKACGPPEALRRL